MKATVYQDQLSYGIGIVYRAISNRLLIPILANILMECDGKRMKLSATNLEIGISVFINVESCEAFSTAVPAKILSDLIDTLDGLLELDYEAETLIVKSEGSKHNIRCIASDDFPKIPSFPETYFSIPAKVFRLMVQRSSISALSPSIEQGAAITGVLVAVERNEIQSIALDRFRMSRCSYEVEKEIGQFKILVPAVMFSEVTKLISSENVSIAYDNEKVQFHTGDIDIFVALLGNIEQFPDYTQLPSSVGKTIFTAKTSDIVKSLKRSAVFTDEKNLVVFNVNPLLVEVLANAQQGESKSTIAGQVVGSPVSVKLNVRYLLDVLGVVGSDETVFMFNGEKGSVFAKAAGDDTFVHLIMPFV